MTRTYENKCVGTIHMSSSFLKTDCPIAAVILGVTMTRIIFFSLYWILFINKTFFNNDINSSNFINKTAKLIKIDNDSILNWLTDNSSDFSFGKFYSTSFFFGFTIR